MKSIFPTLVCLIFFAAKIFAQLPPPCPSNFFPPADNCSEACIYCNFDGINSTTAGYTAGSVPGFCGTIENEQWLGFVAGASSATFTALATNCTDGNGVQIALIENCGSIPIACFVGGSGFADTPAVISVNSMIPGHNYFLVIDGFAGDQCQFNLTVDPPNAVSPPPLGNPGPMQGLTVVCPGATVKYQIPPVSGAGIYVWNAPPGALINGQVPPLEILPAENGREVDITFGSSSGQVCVQVANSCAQPKQICRVVTVTPIPPTNLPPITYCFEDAGGDCFNGFNQFVYQSWLGCDSLVRQQCIVKPPIIKVLQPKSICFGDSISICGQKIDQPGPFQVTCQSWQGCDSTVTGQLLVFNPMAEILVNDTVFCQNSNLVLNSVPSQGVKKWFDGQGQLLGTGSQITVNQPGKYILKVSASSGATTCTVADTISISFGQQPKISFPTQNFDGCHVQSFQISAIVQPSPAIWKWTGPTGFSSTDSMPVIQDPGWYFLSATSSNGCKSMDSVLVGTVGSGAPDFDLSAGILSCCSPSANILIENQPAGLVFSWSGPNNYTSSDGDIFVNFPGKYQLTATDTATGCFRVREILVNQNISLPQISASSSGEITCDQPMATLFGNSTTPGATFLWSGPGGFSSTQKTATATVPGDYTFSVFDSENCCFASKIITVLANLTPPVFETLGNTVLTCAFPNTILTPISPNPNVIFAWENGNGNFSSPGNFTVVATGQNGCKSSQTIAVTEDKALPVFEILGKTILTCDSPTTILTPFSPNSNVTFAWQTFGWPPNEPVLVEKPGNYTVIATGLNGCTASQTAEVIDSCLISTKNSRENFGTVKIYPNTADREFFVETDSPAGISGIRATDAAGRLVFDKIFDREKLLKIEVAEWPAGVYFLLVKIGDGWRTASLVVK